MFVDPPVFPSAEHEKEKKKGSQPLQVVVFRGHTAVKALQQL